jgi:hypothetical protein
VEFVESFSKAVEGNFQTQDAEAVQGNGTKKQLLTLAA